MQKPSRSRVTIIATSVIALSAAVSGVTYAATSTTASPTVKACRSSAGKLALLTKKGKCPSGYAA
ncbi:MAG TPA: hypothetical protein VHZ06_10060, partial [Marmoricola sp.]|nr:hypothetical protein [Marmoricola sp.]